MHVFILSGKIFFFNNNNQRMDKLKLIIQYSILYDKLMNQIVLKVLEIS